MKDAQRQVNIDPQFFKEEYPNNSKLRHQLLHCSKLNDLFQINLNMNFQDINSDTNPFQQEQQDSLNQHPKVKIEIVNQSKQSSHQQQKDEPQLSERFLNYEFTPNSTFKEALKENPAQICKENRLLQSNDLGTSQIDHQDHQGQFEGNQKSHQQKIQIQYYHQQKTEIQEEKSDLYANKEKKQEDKKKKLEKLHQQQKQKLQKLRQQNHKFLEVKKLKDKQIQKFKKQLNHLKISKENQTIKKQTKLSMYEIEEQRKIQQKFYHAMMQQKQVIDKKLAQREQQRKRMQEESIGLMKRNKVNLNSKFIKQMRRKQEQQRVMHEQQRKKREQEQLKIEQIKLFLKRNNSYQEKIKNLELEVKKQKLKPVKQKSEVQVRSQERRLNAKSLSAAEIYRMGQEYMEQVHSNISPQHIEHRKGSFDITERSLIQSSRTEYKDYLKESKLKRDNFFKSTGKLKIVPEIRELKNLMVKEDNSPQKLLKAKLLTEKLDQKASKNPSTRMKVDSIAAKLKIIKEFS